MKLGKYVFSIMTTMGLAILLASPAMAHSVFKKELQKKYPDKKISCNACHIDKKPKTERNEFGKLFQKQLEAQEITKNWKAKKGTEKKDYEAKVMVPEFQKALAKVTSMTYDDIIKSGLVSGIDILKEGESVGGDDDSDSDDGGK